MYCPKCGQQQVSEGVLFCSRCGFNLNVVRASVAGEHDGAFATTTPPPHRDINSGVLIMLLGVLFTSGVVLLGNVKVAGAFLVLTLTFISTLLSSRHLARAIHRPLSWEEPPGNASAGRKGLAFGALLMYLGTVLSACAATLVTGRLGVPAFFFALLTVFALLLLSSRSLMRAVQELLTEERPQPAGYPRPRVATASLPEVGTVPHVSVLPPAQGTPATVFAAQHVRTAEMAAPPSVTERTTSLLGDE
jgi:hypothetical protein